VRYKISNTKCCIATLWWWVVCRRTISCRHGIGIHEIIESDYIFIMTSHYMLLFIQKFTFTVQSHSKSLSNRSVSGLCDTSYLIQDVVSPHCGDEWSLSENYFMPSWRWNTWFNRLLYQEFSHIHHSPKYSIMLNNDEIPFVWR
jgi:hypothetical protein